MHYLILRFPAAFPIGMTLFNIWSLATGILWEGRIREGAWKFSLAYATTIVPAMRGDLIPFFTVLCRPG